VLFFWQSDGFTTGRDYAILEITTQDVSRVVKEVPPDTGRKPQIA
jgi:hypothetical protein